MRRLVAVVGLLLSLAGCQEARTPPIGTSYEFIIDPKFNDHQRVIVEEAINAWGDAVGIYFDHWVGYCNVPNAPRSVCIFADDDKRIITQLGCVSADKFIGCTLDYGFESSVAGVYTQAPDDQFRNTVEHEIGHALGLHHGRKGTVMQPTCTERTVTCEDVEEFWRIRHMRGVCHVGRGVNAPHG